MRKTAEALNTDLKALRYNETVQKERDKIVPSEAQKKIYYKNKKILIKDDGSRQGSGLHINVYGFSNADVDKLMFTLQDKFNLKCSIHYNRNNKPRIYIFKESGYFNNFSKTLFY